jgi:hypothetical protein
VEINTGQSITWVNPTTVGEPHTVTFVLDNKTTAGVVSPLTVPNSTQFMPIPPGSNNQPVMMPGKSIIIALNARDKNNHIQDLEIRLLSLSKRQEHMTTSVFFIHG